MTEIVEFGMFTGFLVVAFTLGRLAHCLIY